MTKSRDVASHSDSPFALTSEVAVSVFFFFLMQKAKNILRAEIL